MKKEKQSRNTAMSRRDFLRISGLVGGTALVTACAPQAPAAGGEEGTAPAQAATTITWWNEYSTPSTQEVVPQIVAAYEELYPDVKVEYELSGGPPGGGEYMEVLLARIAAGNPPDTATLFSPPVELAARGTLAALDEYMVDARWATPDAFFEGPLDSCRWQGNIYGLPASAGAGSIFINVEMFKERGIPADRESFPTTWEGLRALSAEFVEWDGDELVSAGLVPWAASWLYPVWSGLNGGELFDDESLQYTLTQPENVEWLTFWLEWLEDQYRGDIETLALYPQFESPYTPGAFNEGLSAMVQAGSWACNDADLPFEWEVVKFPVGPNGTESVTGFWPNWFVVPTGGANSIEAFQFCEYFSTRGWEIWYTSIMDTPAWRGFPEGVLPADLVAEQGEEEAQEIHDFFADYLASTVDMWDSPVENFASDTLNAAIDEVMHKVKTPAQALEEAQALVQARLEEMRQAG